MLDWNIIYIYLYLVSYIILNIIDYLKYYVLFQILYCFMLKYCIYTYNIPPTSPCATSVPISSTPRLHYTTPGASIDPHDAGGAIEDGYVHVACHAADTGEFRPRAASNLVRPNIRVLRFLRFWGKPRRISCVELTTQSKWHFKGENDDSPIHLQSWGVQQLSSENFFRAT
jgi:hypothetical protein